LPAFGALPSPLPHFLIDATRERFQKQMCLDYLLDADVGKDQVGQHLWRPARQSPQAP
jgi:hypothetical protein